MDSLSLTATQPDIEKDLTWSSKVGYAKKSKSTDKQKKSSK